MVTGSRAAGREGAAEDRVDHQEDPQSQAQGGEEPGLPAQRKGGQGDVLRRQERTEGDHGPGSLHPVPIGWPRLAVSGRLLLGAFGPPACVHGMSAALRVEAEENRGTGRWIACWR